VHNTIFFYVGNRLTTISKVAVWKWIYIYHMVSLRSDKFSEYWTRKAVFVLVSIRLLLWWKYHWLSFFLVSF
jgi:hypothetical protein